MTTRTEKATAFLLLAGITSVFVSVRPSWEKRPGLVISVTAGALAEPPAFERKHQLAFEGVMLVLGLAPRMYYTTPPARLLRVRPGESMRKKATQIRTRLIQVPWITCFSPRLALRPATE